jgi:hypothetical protein
MDRGGQNTMGREEVKYILIIMGNIFHKIKKNSKKKFKKNFIEF